MGKILRRREWFPHFSILAREFHGQRSLVGYSPQDCKESDTTERFTHTHTHTHTHAHARTHACTGWDGPPQAPMWATSTYAGESWTQRVSKYEVVRSSYCFLEALLWFKYVASTSEACKPVSQQASWMSWLPQPNLAPSSYAMQLTLMQTPALYAVSSFNW